VFASVAVLLVLGRAVLCTQQRLQRFAEVARADTLEVPPRNQFLDALGFSQIRRRNLRAEWLSFFRPAAVMDARLFDFDSTQAGGNLPLRKPAVADHLAATRLVSERFALRDPLGEFPVNGRGQHRLGAFSKDLGQHIAGAKGWKLDRAAGSFLHAGVLLGLVVLNKPQSNPSTPPFSTAIHIFRL